MEAYKKVMMIVVLGIMIIGSGPMLGNAQICGMTKDGFDACLPCVSGDKVDPDKACCTAIGNANLKCLCSYKNSGLLSFYGVDPNKAMELPVKCKVVNSFHC